jgi:alpha-1,6-mannosyltransferase
VEEELKKSCFYMNQTNSKAPENLYLLALFLSCYGMACFVPLQNFSGLMFFWSIALISFFQIAKQSFSTSKQFWFVVIAVRLCFFASLPMISTDVFRFLWDGELLHLGINPYDYTPDALFDHPKMQSEYFKSLLDKMGWLSRDNHSCYPFMKQIIFWISTVFSDNLYINIFVMRILLLLADLGVIIFIQKLLVIFKKPAINSYLYAFNPLILVEFMGGMHFEGVLLFFLLAAIYFWFHQRWLAGSILFAMAVQVKLIPLMFLPFLFFYAGFRKSLFSYLYIGVFILVTSIVYLKAYNLPNFLFSVQLYFGQFEFNAGAYMIFKWYSYQKYHFFRLAYYGRFLSKIATISILFIAFFRKQKSEQSFINGLFFASMLYYMLVPIVHPWYITIPLVLGLFTQFNVAFLWCIIIPVSYLHYQEKFSVIYYVVVLIEYIIVLAFFLYELKRNRPF